MVNHGASQSFTISPSANYTIGSVVVDGSSVGAVTSYTFTNVTAPHTISASFNAIQQNSLNVTKAGSGNGVVTSTPAGINCGSDCSEGYNAGASVTLTASPDASSTFSGWSGACSRDRDMFCDHGYGQVGYRHLYAEELYDNGKRQAVMEVSPPLEA